MPLPARVGLKLVPIIPLPERIPPIGLGDRLIFVSIKHKDDGMLVIDKFGRSYRPILVVSVQPYNEVYMISKVSIVRPEGSKVPRFELVIPGPFQTPPEGKAERVMGVDR